MTVTAEPVAAVRAGAAAADTLERLEHMRIDPDLPVAGHLQILYDLQGVARDLSACAALGQKMAVRAVSPHTGAAETPAGSEVSALLGSVNRHAGRAADYAGTAHNSLHRLCLELSRDEGITPGRYDHLNVRVSGRALILASLFRHELVIAARLTVPVVPGLAGYYRITGSAVRMLTRAGWLFGHLSESVTDAAVRRLPAGPGHQATRAIRPVHDAAAELQRAASAARRAEELAHRYYLHVRHGSGAPCTACDGSGKFRSLPACLRCIGTGIDPEPANRRDGPAATSPAMEGLR